MYPATSVDFDLGFSLHASERESERGRFRTMDFLSMLSALPTELQSTHASYGLCDAGIFYRTVSKHSDDLVALRGMIEAVKRKGEEHRHELATRAPKCFVDEKNRTRSSSAFLFALWTTISKIKREEGDQQENST